MTQNIRRKIECCSCSCLLRNIISSSFTEGSTYLQHYIQCLYQSFLQIFTTQLAALVVSSNIFKACEGPDRVWKIFKDQSEIK